MYAFSGGPEAAGASGALASMPGGEQPHGNGTIVYFSCEDCSVEATVDQRYLDLEGRKIRIIGYDGLIKNKLASGRARDLDDGDALTRRIKRPGGASE